MNMKEYNDSLQCTLVKLSSKSSQSAGGGMLTDRQKSEEEKKTYRSVATQLHKSSITHNRTITPRVLKL